MYAYVCVGDVSRPLLTATLGGRETRGVSLGSNRR